ncbi:MAG: hypothetical protein ACRCZF_06090, partial [Gemmataceae bacterium]
FQLRSMLGTLPSQSQLRLVDELLSEIRENDPSSDATLIELPSRPPTKAKLLGDLAIVVADGSEEIVVLTRNDFGLDMLPGDTPDRSREPRVRIDGLRMEGSRLDPVSLQNLQRWLTEGGTRPAYR